MQDRKEYLIETVGCTVIAVPLKQYKTVIITEKLLSRKIFIYPKLNVEKKSF